MVGLADKEGAEDLTNIFRTARKDGVIVKPDEPLVPMDASFIDEAKGAENPVIICSTFTKHDASTAAYVFAWQPKHAENPSCRLNAKSLGLEGEVYVYDFFNGSGQVVNQGETCTLPLNSSDSATPAWAYRVVAAGGTIGDGR